MSTRMPGGPVLATALTIAAAFAAAGITPSQERPKSDDKPVIVVTGCVDGSWLHVRKTDPVGSYTTRYKLRGAKQLMKELAAHHNHLVEATGAVTDTSGTTHRGKTVQVGKKTRITTGAKEVPAMPSGSDPSLDVHAFRDLKESCK
jgi:hypothetical protein